MRSEAKTKPLPSGSQWGSRSSARVARTSRNPELSASGVGEAVGPGSFAVGDGPGIGGCAVAAGRGPAHLGLAVPQPPVLGPGRAVGADHGDVPVVAPEEAEEQRLPVGGPARPVDLGAVLEIGELPQTRSVHVDQAEVGVAVLQAGEGDLLPVGAHVGVPGPEPGAEPVLLLGVEVVHGEIVVPAPVAQEVELAAVGRPGEARVHPAVEGVLLASVEIVDDHVGDAVVAVLAADVGQLAAVGRVGGMVVEDAAVDVAEVGALEEALREDLGDLPVVLFLEEPHPVAVELARRDAEHAPDGDLEAEEAHVLLELVHLVAAVLVGDVDAQGEPLVVDHLGAVSAGAVAQGPQLVVAVQVLLEDRHAQDHVAVGVPGVPAELVGAHLGDALDPPLGGVEVVEGKVERDVRVRVEAAHLDQTEAEGPLLAGLVQGHDVGDLVGEHVADPVVLAADLPVQVRGPDVDLVRVVGGGAVAVVGVVADQDVDRGVVVVVAEGRGQVGEDLLGDLGHAPGGALRTRGIGDDVVIGADAARLGAGGGSEQKDGGSHPEGGLQGAVYLSGIDGGKKTA